MKAPPYECRQTPALRHSRRFVKSGVFPAVMSCGAILTRRPWGMPGELARIREKQCADAQGVQTLIEWGFCPICHEMKIEGF